MIRRVKKILNRMVFIERGSSKYFELGEFIDLTINQLSRNRYKKMAYDFNKWDFNALKLADFSFISELLNFNYEKKVKLIKAEIEDINVLFPINIILRFIDFLYLYQNRNKFFHSKLNLAFTHTGNYAICNILTDIKSTEHWFRLGSQNGNYDAIHQVTTSFNLHSSFTQVERKNYEDKCLICVKFDLQAYYEEEKNTINILKNEIGFDGLQEIKKNENHVIFGHSKDSFIKIFDSRIILTKKSSLFSEYIFLDRLKHLNGFPRVMGYKRLGNYEILTAEKIEGQSLDDFLTASNVDNELLFRLFDQIRKLKRNCISHRDLKDSNIFITSDNEVFIIDFDQAVLNMDFNNQIDMSKSKYSINSPMFTLNRTLSQHIEMKERINEIQNRLRILWKEAARSDSSSPGREIAYYSYDFGDLDLPGERDFFERYLLFEKNNISFKNKKVVELGCNLGLFGSYSALYGAKDVLCIDIDEKIIACAKEFSELIGLHNIKHQVRDLNVRGSFADIEQIDLLFSLSVLYWLSDTTEFDKLMMVTNEVLYEGHEQYDLEIKRLKNWGFSDINPIGMTSRFRTIFYATK